MRLIFKTFDQLTEEERKIRTDVFQTEQGFQEEFDSTDRTAEHILAYDEEAGDLPVACCRVFPDEKEAGTMIIGRLAVIQSYRRKGVGREMLQFTEQYLRERGVKKERLAAQADKKGFYEACGFHPVSEVFLEENYPHIMMEWELS